MDDTTNTDTDTGPDRDRDPDPEADADAQALVETLAEEGVMNIDERRETATITADFEDTYAVYLDTYRSVSDDEFVDSVDEVFGFDAAEATARRIEALDVTREQFAAYLALESYLDGKYTVDERSRMAVVVGSLEPETPVPDGVERLDEDTYEAFVAAHDRAIVTVWKRRCDPCDAMKDDLDAILAAVPEDITVGGIDGEEETEFRREYGIDAAPALLLFENGRLREGFSGRATPERVGAACAEVYGS